MSYYYNYYIGYKHNGKIYPLGPYDCNGKLKDVVSRSRSFASDLHESFDFVDENMISDELRKEFEYEDWNGNKKVDVKYLPLKELPYGDFISKGYFLIDSVREYEKGEDDFENDLEYDKVDPVVYAAMVKNEIVFGKPSPKKDIEGGEMEVHGASDYMYYAYPNYSGKEYEAFVIRQVAEMLGEFNRNLPEGYEVVILETEG